MPLPGKTFRLLTGQESKTLPKVPTLEQTTNELWQTLGSQFPLLTLGYGASEGPQYLAEEDRGNIHVLGSPRQGKSKLLQHLIEHGIRNGQGATLLDPTENGETARSVLKYCAKVGFEKVVYLDPHDFLKFAKVPCVNPIKYKAPAAAVCANLMGVLRVAWDQKNFANTPRIQKYLPAVISALHASGMTLAEAYCFIDREKHGYRRNAIIQKLSEWDDNRTFLESAFKNIREWDGFLPTINRLGPFRDSTMELIVGSKTGLNFQKLIRDKYLIIVNLDPTGIWDVDQQVTLGTLILSELQYAVSRLRYHGWEGRHYIYLDEAGLFATRQLAHFLYYKPKTGLLFTFAHHSFDQFEDHYVLSAVRNATPVKMMFFVDNPDDRNRMIKDLGYGGELTDREVSYALSQTQQRYCAWKNNKRSPIIFRMVDVPEPEVSRQQLADFKTIIYAQDFYRSPQDVRAEINNRFAIHPRPAAKAKAAVPDNQTGPAQAPAAAHDNPPTAPGDRSDQPSSPESSSRSRRSPIFDHSPDSQPVLRDKRGRPARKRPKGTPPAG